MNRFQVSTVECDGGGGGGRHQQSIQQQDLPAGLCNGPIQLNAFNLLQKATPSTLPTTASPPAVATSTTTFQKTGTVNDPLPTTATATTISNNEVTRKFSFVHMTR